jgi:hypothetical protein
MAGQGVAFPATALCGDSECDTGIGKEGVLLLVLALCEEGVVLSGVWLREFRRVVFRGQRVLIVTRKERTEAGKRDFGVDLWIPGEVVVVLGKRGRVGTGLNAGEGVDGGRRGRRGEDTVRGVLVWGRREGWRFVLPTSGD